MNYIKNRLFCGKMYREMTEGAARIVGIQTIATVGLRLTPNKRFYEMSALPRVDKY